MHPPSAPRAVVPDSRPLPPPSPPLPLPISDAPRCPSQAPLPTERSNPIRTLSPYSRKRSSPTASSSIPPSRSEAPADPILRSDNRFEKLLPNRTLPDRPDAEPNSPPTIHCVCPSQLSCSALGPSLAIRAPPANKQEHSPKDLSLTGSQTTYLDHLTALLHYPTFIIPTPLTDANYPHSQVGPTTGLATGATG